MFNSVNEAFDWMVSFTNLEKKPDLSKRGYRLDKMVGLLNLFGNPQNSYKIIHVAGSKGKGSTCGFLGSILETAGYKTGIYSSPHLLDYRERITNNHKFFEKESYTDVIWGIKAKIDNIDFSTFPGGEPTTFEIMTLSAFIIFKKEKCDWVVIETGIGGRLDSTNVVMPAASVITPIELEHTEILGNTLEEITVEKAGIIKPGIPVFTSNTEIRIVNIIKEVANRQKSTVTSVPKEFSCDISKNGTILNYNNTAYSIGLEGAVQAENALLAMLTIKNILPNITDDIVIKGLKNTRIPGRFHKVEVDPVVILDGAHTKNSMNQAVNTFKKIYNEGTVIFGAIKGKDIDSMALIIKDNFDNIIISTPGSFKECDIDSIVNVFKKYKSNVIKIENVTEAYKYAKELNRPILVTGSFYMAGEIARLVDIK